MYSPHTVHYVRRLSLWMRTHPMVGDSLVAALLVLIDLALFLSNPDTSRPALPPWYISMPLNIVAVAPLIFRRKRPLLAAYLVLLLSIPHDILELGIASATASCICLYTVLIYLGRRPAFYFVGAFVTTSTILLAAFSSSAEIWPAAIILVLSIAFCWVLGEFVGARRAYHAEMEARLHLLETERGQATRIAIGEERSRIARELHDVVAHAVSVMVVQADGASYTLESDPASAKQAVHTISKIGREALAELRRLLNVLRNEAGDNEPRVPQPNAEALAELAERVQIAGVPVKLEIHGTLAELPPGISLGIYRIVQESLTNILKHAGRGARAKVTVTLHDEVVEIIVIDDAGGKARDLGTPPTKPIPGGNGVIGMRERAHVFGGELEVGPQPGGGWRVHANLPVRFTS